MPTRALVCLLLASLATPACGDGEERVPDRDPGLPRYTGLEAEPVRSSSRVEGARSRHELPEALQGDRIRHDFLIENDSEATLELRDAAAAGGIVESYSRSIPPGRTGRISVRVLTDSRGGETVEGEVRAVTNDPRRPELSIDFSLFVKRFAHVFPYRVWLRGSAGEEIVETCTIVPAAEYPFTITDVLARKGVWFEYELRETRREGRPAYEIEVRNTRTRPGPYQDVLFVRTDHEARPELRIRIEGRIRE